MRIGRHSIIDVVESPSPHLGDESLLRNVLVEAARHAGATVEDIVSRKFEGGGEGVYVIVGVAESHVTIHTYPEFAAYFLDAFLCGDLDPCVATHFVVAILGGRVVGDVALDRGLE